MLKNLRHQGRNMLTKIFNLAWTTGEVSKEWSIGITIPLHKRGAKEYAIILEVFPC